MRATSILSLVLILGAGAAAAIGWQKAARLGAENASLREQLANTKAEVATVQEASRKRENEAQKTQQQTSELMKLRNEVTQLRAGNKAGDALRAEIERLRAENQHLRNPGDPVAEAAAEAPRIPGGGTYPRDSWNFAGYTTPEAALVSAVWAMKQGDSRTYFGSLTPDEQQRMTQAWQGKDPQEIAAKHQEDVSNINSVRVLEQQQISPTEVLMNVYVDGPNRTERVRMTQVGQEWKFGGFMRDPQ